MGVFQIRVKVEKNPELGFSISGGVGGRGNPFRPDDNVNVPLFFVLNRTPQVSHQNVIVFLNLQYNLMALNVCH